MDAILKHLWTGIAMQVVAVSAGVATLMAGGTDVIAQDNVVAQDNVIAQDQVLMEGQAGGGEQSPVERRAGGGIDVRAFDTRLADLLQEMAKASGRSLVVGPGVDGHRVTVSLTDLTLEEVLGAILPGTQCAFRDRGKYIEVDSLESFAEREGVGVETQVRVVRLEYVNAQDVAEMITPFLGEGGVVVASPEAGRGIGSEGEDAGGNSMAGDDVLIIEGTPVRLDQLESIIDEIDVRPIQILVEATILRSALNDDNQLGVDFNFLAGVDFEAINSISNAGLDLVGGDVPSSEFDSGVIALQQTASVPITDGFTFGLIKNNVSVFIRALERLNDTVVLANPKIMTLNKQRGAFIVGRRDGFLTTTVTQTAAIQAVQFLETGTQLSFRPFLLGENEVRMEVHVEDSAGGLTPAQLPFESTTESTTNIIIEDGHTILIAGLFRSSDDISRSQTPGVGEIPWIGGLFRHQNDKSAREEVIVLLTVHIIKNQDEYGAIGAGMLVEAEHVRLGLRERMQWFGRQRLADAHIASAVQNLERGERDRAIFHTRLARSANPMMSVGRRLQNQLLHGRDWIEPNRELRQWVARQLNATPSIDEETGQPIGLSTDHFEFRMPREEEQFQHDSPADAVSEDVELDDETNHELPQ